MNPTNKDSEISFDSDSGSGGVPLPIDTTLEFPSSPPIVSRRHSSDQEPESPSAPELQSNQRESPSTHGISYQANFSQGVAKHECAKIYYLHRHGININGRLPAEAPQFRDQLNMELEATQPATQPYFDPRRAGQSGSLNPEDDADILLFLHPNTAAASKAVQRCAEYSPQHIRQNAGLPDNLGDEDSQMSSVSDSAEADCNGHNNGGHVSSPVEHDLALRLSSRVQDICLGFVFGRDPSLCDIIIKPEDRPVLRISSMHFRIYVTDDGIIMLEDTSTNGTFVDETLLKCKNPEFGVPQRRTLDHGSIISIITWTEKETKKSERAKFIVRIPERSPEAFILYRANLQRYIDARKRAQENAQQNVAHATHKTHKLPNATPDQIVGLGDGLLGIGGARFNHGMRWNGGEEYSVVDQIGKGAFATVYKLATRSEGTLFAAKEIEKLRFAKNGQIDTKINNELEIIKKIDHPHIVKFVDYYDYTTHLYIILEFVGGGDLLGYMHRHGRMHEDIAQSMTRQLCHALSYIHARNITHRDVKPDNILLASLNPLVVKLTDFGLSKMIEAEGGSVLKTFCGTLLYCAPEVYPDYEKVRVYKTRPRHRKEANKGSPRYGSNVDIWSLAAVLFHLLVMEPPFEGKAENQGAGMLQTIMHTRIDFSVFFENGISDDCTNLIESMLRINPEDRPDANSCLRHAWIRDVPDIEQGAQGGAQVTVRERYEGTSCGEFGIEGDSTGYDDETSARNFAQTRELSRGSSALSAIEENRADGNTTNRLASRPRLFGEVTSLGQPDSGIFGAGQAPIIALNDTNEPYVSNDSQAISDNGHFLKNTDWDTMNDERASGLGSAVSQIQELTVDSPGWPPGWPDSRISSVATSGMKRGRENETDEKGTGSTGAASKRIMTLDKSILYSGEESNLTPVGMLSPIPGSIDMNVLLLTERISIWGRYQENSHVFADPMEVRVPKIGMDLIFWCPGIEETIKEGIDWRNLPGTYCLLKTRSSKGIRVNGIALEKDAPEGPFRCAKLMTGDVVEIFNHGEEFLKYECQFFHGESRNKRESCHDFVVEENRELWNSVTARVAELSTSGK